MLSVNFRLVLILSIVVLSANLNTAFAQPANDNCSGAITLTPGTTHAAGTVWNATASPGIPIDCATGTPDDDVWYTFTATAPCNTISLPVIGASLTTNNPRIQLFDGPCGSLKTLSCGTTSLSYCSFVPGTVYYIRIYSATTGAFGTSGGCTFSILVSVNPGNDDCASAILLPTSTSSLKSEGTVVAATASTGVPLSGCLGTPDDDVWYKFVATKSAPTISISNNGANLSAANTRIQLLSGTCGSLTSVTCGVTPLSTSGLTIGNTYYIRIYSNGATAITSAGNFNIDITNPIPDVVTDSTSTLFTIDTVARQLGYPWEVTYGPDDSLWVTEARGYRVLRLSSSRTIAQQNVAPQQVLKIPLGSSEVSFSRTVGTWPQGGMQGLVIHPEFMTNAAKRWVYLSYVYSGTCPGSPAAPCYFRTKIVRCRFYFAADAGNPTSLPKRDTLIIMDTVISNLPGSNDHNSGRLAMGPTPEGGTYKLYYTIGDMGAGQFNNASRTNNAQNKDTCEGKILRLNTEPDGDASYGVTHNYNTWRQWIPNDNPFTHSVFTSLPTPVYSYGHRNAQGIAWGNVNGTWRLYSSEHGDHSDDELNIIESGKNYGWPKVSGLADDNYNTFDNSIEQFTYNDVLANLTVTNEKTWATANAATYKDPIFSFFNWSPAQIEPSSVGGIFKWGTIAPSSIAFYNGAIPGWKNSVIVTSLKYGAFRLKLNSLGDIIDSSVTSLAVDTFPLLHGWRVRDITFNPNPTSGKFWVVIDSTGSTSGPTGGFSGSSGATKSGGKLLSFTYKTLLTLPVNFISFTGKLIPGPVIRLKWIAETDNEHAYFDVEKRINGSWVTIGRILPGSAFGFDDLAPLNGDNIYRIKEVSLDGKPEYSTVINVKYQPSNYIVSVYPNPVHNFINVKISSPVSGKMQVSVIDMQGKIVYRGTQNLNAGLSQMSIPVNGWPAQTYMIKINDQTGTVIYTEKILKN